MLSAKIHVRRVPYLLVSLIFLPGQPGQRQFSAKFSWGIDVHGKWDICGRIFHEKFSLYEHPAATLIYPPEHKMQLKSDYQQIYDDLFVKRRRWWWFFGRFFTPESNYTYIQYENPCKKRRILAQGLEYDDRVFTCVVREEESEIIRPYYISCDEYNMNEAPGQSYMAGRFVFVPDDVENKLIVFALAEESPNNSIHRIPDIQEYYLARRAIHAPAETADDDPICSLDTVHRLRLCTATFVYELKNFKFRVAASTTCVKRRFAMWGSYPGPREYIYEEWMIECLREPAERFKTYVSRAYKDNEAFVFMTYDKDLMIHYLSRKVTVVRDPAEYNVQNRVAVVEN